jgi:hypothetical protein
MTTKHNSATLKETFITGLSAVFKIAGYKKTFFSVWFTKFPIYISVAVSIIFYTLDVDYYQGIIELKNLMINFLPGILGFTVAGYALMVGFIHGDMLDKITEPTGDSNYSTYQKMSATFAVNVILQGFALIIALLAHLIIFIDTNSSSLITTPSNWLDLINIFFFLVLTYWFFISLFMVIQIVLNIFSFSQLHHYFINKRKVDKENNAEQK